MKIHREWLGGSEVIDLGTDEGRHYFANDVVQDEDAAEELTAAIAERDEVVVNEHHPTYIERYTRMEVP